jgi:leucyl-tRNA synthetase
MDYGTGAIMAVPVGDQRDFEFARQEGLEIRVIIRPTDEDGDLLDELDADTMTEAYTGPGVMVNSGEYDGLAGRRPSSASSTTSRPRAGATPRSTTGCATGWSPGSAPGARRSR